MKTLIDLDFFNRWKNKKVCMHCGTRKEARAFINVLKDYGYKDFDYISWERYEDKTGYCFNTGIVKDIDTLELDYTVLEFSDYIVKGTGVICRNSKVYISGPTDFTKEEYSKAIDELLNMGFRLTSIINPTVVKLPYQAQFDDYMRVFLSWLDKCDTIYMLKGWSTDKKSLIEYGYALSNDCAILYQGESENEIK